MTELVGSFITNTPPSTQDILRILHGWSDAGLLRQLDSAFASFIMTLDTDAPPCVAVAVALLSHMEGRGHSCLPLSTLPQATAATLNWPAESQVAVSQLWKYLPQTLEGWVNALRDCRAVRVVHGDADTGQPLILDGDKQSPRLYLRRYWQYEDTIARAVSERCTASTNVDEPSVRRWMDSLFPATARKLDWQQVACAIALRKRLTIITGGPGTGKTYTAARLLALLLALSPSPEHMRVALTAPTGKAAARIKQSIDASLLDLQASLGPTLNLTALTVRIGAARTLHSLLGARPDTRRFRYFKGNPLDVDVVLVDEASMVHLEMMAALLDALPPHASLILLGDKDQLASVEAGAVLGDFCRDAQTGRYDEETLRYLKATTGITLPSSFKSDSLFAPPLAQQTVMLRESRRFHGPIAALARAVNDDADPAIAMALLREHHGGVLYESTNGNLALLINVAGEGREGAPSSYRDYLTLVQDGPDDWTDTGHAHWAASILRAYDRFRVLCAVREGDWGVAGLNRAIETALASRGLLRPQGNWYAGRPIMITRNDPALGVFNGDIGVVLPAPDGQGRRSNRLRAWFLDGNELRSVAVSRLANVETAFAMTVHKSQGSEFDHTVLVLASHSGSVLTRELVYTGITRARNAFSLFAERPGLFETGIAQVTRRQSGLPEKLFAFA